MNIKDLDAKLRAEYAEHVYDHIHIKYCYQCPFSVYVNTREELLERFNNKKCLCCLKKKNTAHRNLMDIHQPVATAKNCPLAALVNRRDYTIDKRIIINHK